MDEELKGIIQRMKEAGEPRENIIAAIDAYQAKTVAEEEGVAVAEEEVVKEEAIETGITGYPTYPIDIQTGEPIGEYSWETAAPLSFAKDKLKYAKETEEYEFESIAKEKQKALKDEYVEKSKEYGAEEGEIASALYGEWSQKNAKIGDYNTHLNKRLHNLTTYGDIDLEGPIETSEMRPEYDISKDIVKLGYDPIPNPRAQWDKGYFNVAGEYLFPKSVSADLMPSEFTDPPRPTPKFYGIVDKDHNLINFEQYWDKHPTQIQGTTQTGDRIVIGSEHSAILRDQPGSYMIDDEEKLKEYADANNLTYNEALNNIQRQGRLFSALQDNVENINKEDDINAGHKNVEPHVLNPGSKEILEEWEITKQILYDNKDAPKVEIKKGEFVESEKYVDTYWELKAAKDEEKKAIENAKGKPNEEQLINEAKVKWNDTKSNAIGELIDGVKKSFTPSELFTAEAEAKIVKTINISDYNVHDQGEGKHGEEVLKYAKESISHLKNYFDPEKGGDDAIKKYLNEKITQGLDVVEGWTDEALSGIEVSEKDLAEALMMVEKSLINGTEGELKALWKNYEDLWNKRDKEGTKGYWDFKTGERVTEAAASKEVKDYNAPMNAASLQISQDYAFSEIRDLRNAAYYNLEAKLQEVLIEGKVGDWETTGLLDYALRSKRLFQELGEVGGPMPTNLSIIPGDGTKAIRDFNEALRQWKIMGKAYMLNMDPATLKRGNLAQHFFGGMGEFFGMNDITHNDQQARSYAEFATSQGGKISELGVERMQQGWQERWGRGAGGITSFAFSYMLNPFSKFRLLKTGGSIDKATKIFKGMVGGRFAKGSIGATSQVIKGVASGVGYDKLMGGLVEQHQEFGAGMWGAVTLGGYFAAPLFKGLSMLEGKALTNEGVNVWKSFKGNLTEVTKNLTYPILMKTPIQQEMTKLFAGAGISTFVMLGSELAVEKISSTHSWEDVWNNVMTPITHRDFYTGEEVRMKWYDKVAHTGAMMIAGHMGHTENYKNTYNAIKTTAYNYKNRKSLPEDYKMFNTTEKEANERYKNGIDKPYLLMLKARKLAEMRRAGVEITKEELTNIDRAIDNIAEANTMKVVKDMLIENDAYDVNLTNVDRELFYLKNRLLSGLNEGADYNLSFEDANMLAEVQPQYLGYLSLKMENSGQLNTPMASLLNSRIQQASHIMKNLRNHSSSKVWNNPTERRNAYNKVNEMLAIERELNAAKNRNKEEKGGLRDLSNIMSDKEIKDLEVKLEKAEIEVKGILKGAEIQRKDIEYARKLGKGLGIEPEEFKSEAEYKAAMKEAGFEGEGTEAAFFYDKGSGRILINKARALRVEAFGAATHDMLHPLTDLKMKAISLGELPSMVKELKADDPLLTDIEAESIASTYLKTHNREARTFTKEFKNALSERELEIVQERLNRDYKYIEESEIKDYNIEDIVTDKEGNPIVEDGIVELKEHAYQHEYPTVLKDAITDNLIKYNESTAKKLGNVFKKAWKGIFPNAKWKSGEDVYEFVRTYAKGVQKGVIPLEVSRKAKEYKKSQKPEVSKIAASRTKPIKETSLKQAARNREIVKQIEKLKAEPKDVELANRIKELESELLDLTGEAKIKKAELIGRMKEGLKEAPESRELKELREELSESNRGLIYDWAYGKGDKLGAFREDLATDIEKKEFKEELDGLYAEIINKYDPSKGEFGQYVLGRLQGQKGKPGYPYQAIGNLLKKAGIDASKKMKSLDDPDLYIGDKEGGEGPDISIKSKDKPKESTMKTAIDLSPVEQIKVKEFVESELKQEVKDLESGDFSFFEEPKFRNKVIKKFGKEFLERIPHPSSEKAKVDREAIDKRVAKKEITQTEGKNLKKELKERLTNEYKTWLEEKLYPEVVDLNKPISEGGDPTIFRRMNWDILYEATGKKYTTVEAKKVQVEQAIKSVTSQRAEYKEKTPTAEEFADFIMHTGKYKNAKSRPNEKRLRIGDFLAEKIVGDALIDVIAKSKNIPEFTKSEVLRQRVLSKMSEILKKDPGISFHKTKEKLQKTPGSLLIDPVKIFGEKGKLTPEIKKEIDKDSLKREEDYIEDLAKKLGVDPELIKNLKLKREAEGEEIAKSLDLPYTPHKDKLGTEKGILMHKKFIVDTVTALEELGIDFNKASSPFVSALHQMFGFGSLKIPSGKTDYLSIKNLLTEKEIDQGIKKISNLEAWRRLTGDNNLGKRKKPGEKLSIEIQKAIKNFYFPEYGYGKRTAGEDYGRGSKGLMQRIADGLGIEALKMSKENRGDSDFVLESRDVYTAPHLRVEAEGLETTQAANRKVLEFVVKAMIKNYTKNPTKANLEVVMNALHVQVNASKGVIKGAVPMQSATAIHESALEKTFDKAAHNEHMVELNEYTKDILNALDKYSKHKNEKFLNKQIEKIVSKLNQALISEKAQVRKDVSGRSIKDFHDIALNTFQTTSILKNQIRLGGKYRGWTEAEILLHEFGKNKIIKAIKSIPESKRSVEAVEMLQKLENESSFNKAFAHNEASLGSFSKTRKPKNIEEQVEAMRITDKALDLGKKLDKKPKKARVFDFDDTLARTKSNVLYELPSGKKGKLTPAEFAEKSATLTAEGAKFDFVEFDKVMEGKKGPLFELAKMIKESKGERDMFVLTARPPEAAKAIHEFLKELGLDIPIENIVGLGNGAPNAKAEWMVEKASEGYNDFYFADDHMKNVEAVDKALSDLQVKSKVQQAKPRPSFSMNTKRDLKWDKYSFGTSATFKVKDQNYRIEMASTERKGKDNYSLIFGQLKKTWKKGEGSPQKLGITGTGNAAEVLSIVSNGVIEFVKNNKVNSISFTSSESSRTRLYERLTKLWADELGWNHKIDIEEMGRVKEGYFTITKPKGEPISSFVNRSKPVKKVLDVLDIKSKSQRASFSKTIDKEFNEILEQSSGVEWFKEFSPAKAEVKGKGKGRFKFFLPPSAEDFLGLVYGTLGKGKVGERQLEWYNKHLFQPYSRAMENLSTDRVNLMKDFKALKKQLGVPKDLRKVTESGFTNEQAVRVYLWNKLGMEVPGLSKTDLKELNSLIEGDSKLQAFGDQILEITKGDGYAKPGKEWLVGTITSDLINLLNTTKRGKYLAEWKQNKDVIYSEKNLNKLESIHGKKYRGALENILNRMSSGRNRTEGGNKLSNTVLNYINQSQGAIMFLNMRSATLQTISAANFTNWSFNNPLKMGKAFANQPRYWKDVVKLINSDYLVDRRHGLKLNIAENEIADAAKTSTNKAKAALNYILEKGYAPTKFADSFAIASGGALFYRNKIIDLMKRDPSMKLEEAERIAFKEFREISETSQQSANPSKISEQQAGDLGRLTLQFVNTPMQYARIQKRAFQDLKNGRGDWKTNVSKILYYGVMQNLWFNFMQQGAFMMGFGDGTEDEEKEKRLFGVYNGMTDSILRGIGLAGMTVSVLKNLGVDIYERGKRDRPEYGDAWKELLGFSPSIKSKLSKFEQAAWPFDSKKRRAEIFEKGFSLDNPAFRSLAKVIEGATGLPLDRLYQKFENISVALDSETEAWQSTAHILGWPEWQLQSQKQKEEKKAKEDPSVYSKDEQVYILKQYGLTDNEIKDLKDEENRVNAILDFQKSKNKVYRPPISIKKYTKLKNDTTKEQQENMLLDLGYSKSEIKSFKYEDDRVNAIMDAKAGKREKKEEMKKSTVTKKHELYIPSYMQ